MLRTDRDMLKPLNYSLNDIFLAQETCGAMGAVNSSVISVFGWLASLIPALSSSPTSNV